VTFCPSPDHEGHKLAEDLLEAFCKIKGWKCEPCENYYDTMKPERIQELINDFSENALRVRSQPDKLVFIGSQIFPIDLKSTVRKDTGNIAIELSSYYFSMTCYNSLFCYYIKNEDLAFFSPRNNFPHTIYLQPKWRTNPFFKRVVRHLRLRDRRVKVVYLKTSGSGDPFVLLDKKTIRRLRL
jgi:hypothetical protein